MSPPVALLVLAEASKHEVNASVSRNVAPSNKIRLNLNTRDVPLVHVSAMPIDGPRWLVGGDPEGKRPQATGPVVQTWDVAVATKGQRPNPNQSDTYASRQINLPPMKPDVYLLNFAGGDKPTWVVVNVTDFKAGALVPGADVIAYRRNGEVVRRKATGADGAALMDLAPGDETFVVRRGGDYAGVAAAQSDPNGALRAHFQTDRPIYRPGQKVRFKAILRRTLGQGHSVVANKLCKVQTPCRRPGRHGSPEGSWRWTTAPPTTPTHFSPT